MVNFQFIMITVYGLWAWQIHFKAYHQEMLVEVLYLHFMPVLPLQEKGNTYTAVFYIFLFKIFRQHYCPIHKMLLSQYIPNMSDFSLHADGDITSCHTPLAWLQVWTGLVLVKEGDI